QNGDSLSKKLFVSGSKVIGAILDLRKKRARNAENGKELFIPLIRRNVEEQGTRCIGRVSGVNLAAGQAPDEKSVDGAGEKLPLLGPPSGSLTLVEQPGDLRPGKIGIEQQAGLAGKFRLQPLLREPSTKRRGAPVLPDNGVVDRLSGRLVPDNDSFALIGNTDRRNVRGVELRLAQCRPCRPKHGRPDFFRIVLDPAGCRIVLCEFLLSKADDSHLRVEHDRTR